MRGEWHLYLEALWTCNLASAILCRFTCILHAFCTHSAFGFVNARKMHDKCSILVLRHARPRGSVRRTLHPLHLAESSENA